MNFIKLFFIGSIIGVANIIPGVSGGTMALVLGIYERLIKALRLISPQTIKIFFSLFIFKRQKILDFKKEWQRIDGLFLFFIFTGALLAIVALAPLMTYLLHFWHDYTYAFFLGLVLMSAFTPYKLIRQKTIFVFLMALLALSGVIFFSEAVSEKTLLKRAEVKSVLKQEIKKDFLENKQKDLSPNQGFVFFLMGVISISAMLLPGVSGSFLLLLMGGYFKILEAIASRDFFLLGFFSLGCLAGIVFFTRLINYFLSKWFDLTMSFLLGLVLGSLWVLWPFKTKVLVGSEVVYLKNFWPTEISMSIFFTFLFFLLGLFLVWMAFQLERLNRKKVK